MKTPRTALLVLALGAMLPAVHAQGLTPTTPRATHVNGTVTTSANGSYAVTSRRDPTPVTFTLSTKVHVVRLAMGTLSALQVGSAVRVNGTVSTDGASITADRITILATLPKHGGGAVTPGGKAATGTVTTVTPLKITSGDGTQISVDTSSSPRVMVQTAAGPADIVVGAHIIAALNAQGAAREVMILPARRARRGANAGL